MVYSYYSLSSLIKVHHPIRYSEIKKAMRFFFIFEFFPLFITELNYIFDILNMLSTSIISTPFTYGFYDIYLLVWTVYPVIQAYGLVRLKDTKDPL